MVVVLVVVIVVVVGFSPRYRNRSRKGVPGGIPDPPWVVPAGPLPPHLGA